MTSSYSAKADGHCGCWRHGSLVLASSDKSCSLFLLFDDGGYYSFNIYRLVSWLTERIMHSHLLLKPRRDTHTLSGQCKTQRMAPLRIKGFTSINILKLQEREWPEYIYRAPLVRHYPLLRIRSSWKTFISFKVPLTKPNIYLKANIKTLLSICVYI